MILPAVLLLVVTGDASAGVPGPVRPSVGAHARVAAAPQPREGADELRLDVLAGVARVRAGEANLELRRGECLPGDAKLRDRLELEAGSRVRLSTERASLELHGPLTFVPDASRALGFQVRGTGRLRVESRAAPVELELDSTARLELPRGLYWAEGLIAGGWRVGCEAGEPLVLRPLEGLRWAERPRVAPGASLRLVPARFAGPKSDLAGGRLAVKPWSRFQWPWGAPDESRPAATADEAH